MIGQERGNLAKIRLETSGHESGDSFDGFLRLPRHRIVSDLILKHSGTESSILDIGCGIGCSQLKYLRTKGYRKLSGMDFCLKDGANFEGIILYDQDLEKQFEVEEKFDVIIMADVLEHLRSPRLALKNALSRLNDGGVLIISVPNSGHYLNGLLLTLLPRHLNMSSAFGPWGHCYCFTYYGLMKTFKLFNLKIVGFSGSALEFRYMPMAWIKRLIMWCLSIFSVILNFGIFRRFFSDHLYFVLAKENNEYLGLPDEIIYEANV